MPGGVIDHYLPGFKFDATYLLFRHQPFNFGDGRQYFLIGQRGTAESDQKGSDIGGSEETFLHLVFIHNAYAAIDPGAGADGNAGQADGFDIAIDGADIDFQTFSPILMRSFSGVEAGA